MYVVAVSTADKETNRLNYKPKTPEMAQDVAKLLRRSGLYAHGD